MKKLMRKLAPILSRHTDPVDEYRYTCLPKDRLGPLPAENSGQAGINFMPVSRPLNDCAAGRRLAWAIALCDHRDEGLGEFL